MVHRGATKSGAVSEIVLTGSGMIMFIPLLLILIASLAGFDAFR